MKVTELRLFQTVRHPVALEENYFTLVKHPTLSVDIDLAFMRVWVDGRSICTPLSNVRSWIEAPNEELVTKPELPRGAERKQGRKAVVKADGSVTVERDGS